MLYVLAIPFSSGEDTDMHAYAAGRRLYTLPMQCMLFVTAQALKWSLLHLYASAMVPKLMRLALDSCLTHTLTCQEGQWVWKARK